LIDYDKLCQINIYTGNNARLIHKTYISTHICELKFTETEIL